MKIRATILDSFAYGAIPAAFVLLWSTGWIVARLAAEDAEPLTFLLYRYAGAATCIGIFALLARAEWPRTGMDWVHAFVSGIFIHAFYLAGIWWAVAHGVPASISALMASLQPILSALLAPYVLGERIRALQWLGVTLGFAGLVLVLTPKLLAIDPGQMGTTLWPLGINVLGMISLTVGTFYQKRFVRTGDLRTVTMLQFVASFAVTLPMALLFENMRVTWTPETVVALVWSVVAVSIVSIALLLFLIRNGDVSRSAQLVYLVPPAAAIQAWLLFGERLSAVQLGGMMVTALGVALAVRR